MGRKDCLICQVPGTSRRFKSNQHGIACCKACKSDESIEKTQPMSRIAFPFPQSLVDVCCQVLVKNKMHIDPEIVPEGATNVWNRLIATLIQDRGIQFSKNMLQNGSIIDFWNANIEKN